MEVYRWSEHTSYGFYLDRGCLQNVHMLYDLIGRFSGNGYLILGINDEGVIVQKKDDVFLDTKFALEDKIRLLESHINTILNDMRVIQYVTPDPKGKEITAEFFILFDFLPEHIKKELKIYIKQ